mgnify:CR=1 FL=1
MTERNSRSAPANLDARRVVHARIALGLVLSALWLAGCSLAGDVTPPPGLSAGVRQSAPMAGSVEAQPPVVNANSFPSAAPSIVQGATVFADHCAACHGVTGRGDGEKSAELLGLRGEPVPDFTTPERLDPRTPGELYQTVTQGNLEKFMPPFGESLTDAERWSAVAFLYTLSAPTAVVEQGQAVFDAQCAECHSPEGAASPPEGDPVPTDFLDQAYMAAQSQAGLIAALGVHEPPLETELGVDDQRAVNAYVRTLAFGTEATSAAVTSIGAPAATDVGRVGGRIAHGTQGAALPAGLEIVLRGYDDFSQALMMTTTVGSDGAFDFADVPAVSGRQFMLTTEHAGLSYSSDIFNFEAGLQVTGLALTIYDGTPDTSAVRIERLQVVVAGGEGSGPFTVSELVLFANLGDKTVTGAGGPVVEVPLPSGATAVAVQGLVEGSDYVRTPDGVGLLWPIRPGPSVAQLTLTFQLPAGSSLDFNQRMTYPVQALDLLVGETLSVTGDGLQDRGLETLQERTVHAYSGGEIAVGDSVSFSLSAPPGAALPGLPAVDIGLLAAGVALLTAIGVGGYWRWRRRAGVVARPQTDSLESLLQAIADLDDAYADGALQPQAYQRERAQLKAQLVALSGSTAIE